MSKRILALDHFRGFTIAIMVLVNNPGSWSNIYAPLKHAVWHGLTFTDLVFPFFLFIVGFSIYISREKNFRQNKRELLRRIIIRSLVLFVIGFVLNIFPFSFFDDDFDFNTLRITGVLQRIAVCYFFAFVTISVFNKKQILITFVFLLLLYVLMLNFIPFPGSDIDPYQIKNNLASYIDNIVLGTHNWKYTKTWDPEGILSTVPAVSTVLSGYLAATLFHKKLSNQYYEKLKFMATGFAFILVGWIISVKIPFNKNLWTPSFVFVTSGIALLVFEVFRIMAEKSLPRKIFFSFKVFGVNSIFTYIVSIILARLLNFIEIGTGSAKITLKKYIYSIISSLPLDNKMASLLFAIGFLWVIYLFSLLLYKKNVIIKL